MFKVRGKYYNIKSMPGFTLIETLVVIAMIGILSTVVLYALGPSRNKAKDTKIITYLNELRAKSASYYDPLKGKYDIVGFLDNGGVKETFDSIKSMGVKKCFIIVRNNDGINVFLDLCDGYNIAAEKLIREQLDWVVFISFSSELLNGDAYCVDTLGNSSNSLGEYNKPC